MPIYEYRCTACGHELESLQKFSDAPLSDCPACTTPSLTKLVSAAGFHLKGSGWYATDFKGSGKPAAGKSAADGKPTASKPGDDGKPAAANSEVKTDSAPAPVCGSGA